MMNYNKKRQEHYKYIKEIEIKICNHNICNCSLCKNNLECMKKVTEINKNVLKKVNTNEIFYAGKNFHNIKYNKLSTNNYHISFEGKKYFKFTKSKTLHSFVAVHEYIPKRSKDIMQTVKNINSEAEILESIKKYGKKENSQNKIDNKEIRESIFKKEKYIDIPQTDKSINNFNFQKVNSKGIKKEENEPNSIKEKDIIDKKKISSELKTFKYEIEIEVNDNNEEKKDIKNEVNYFSDFINKKRRNNDNSYIYNYINIDNKNEKKGKKWKKKK